MVAEIGRTAQERALFIGGDQNLAHAAISLHAPLNLASPMGPCDADPPLASARFRTHFAQKAYLMRQEDILFTKFHFLWPV